ncbi:MAG: PAS domain S-box protein [Balneolaceae bacterium]
MTEKKQGREYPEIIPHEVESQSEKKTAKSSTRSNRQKLYEAIISDTSDYVCVFDLSFRITYLNDALLKKWELTVDEAIGRNLPEIGYEQWQVERLEQEMARVVAGKKPVRGEIPYEHNKLGPRVYQYNFIPVFNNMKKVEFVAGISKDITQHRQGERSERKYQSLFESIDEGFCIIEMIFDDNNKPVDYRFRETNPSFEKQTGLKNAEGKRMRELRPQHDEHWFKIFGTVALTGKPIRFENSVDSLDRWYSVYAFRFGEPEDRKIAVLFKNITERKQNEHNNALLSAIVGNSDDAIISKNLNGIITSWNTGAERMFGYPAQETIGRPVTILIPPERLTEENEILERLKNGERVEHFETIRLHKKGTPVDVSLTVSPIRDAKGEISGASKIARNISHQKQTEAKLQALNDTLEERVNKRTATLLAYQKKLRSLVSELSAAEEHERQRLASELHDNLGQTLAIGKMKLDQLQKNLASGGNHSTDGVAELMDEAIRYTRELMSDLKPPPTLNKGNLKEVLAWVVYKMKKYDLDVTIDDDEHPKPLSEEVLTTVRLCVRELLFNVVKHAGVNYAHISLSRRGEQVQIVIEDKGKGFDPDKTKITPGEEGGFGLFNISERIDLLGGSLKIISNSGKGTKAVLLVPLKGKQAEFKIPESPRILSQENNTSATLAPADSQKDSRIRVLLVDDHKMMREGLRKIIEEEEDLVVVAEASDGKEAVKMTNEISPDVIVMDVNMPIMNGIEATRTIVSDNPDVRIIGLSLHDSKNVAKAMKKAGASAYLTKTEAVEALCKTIRADGNITDSQPG